jgi:hypothetical protein
MFPASHAVLADASGIDLSWIDPTKINDWDSRLVCHPHATVFHSRGWAQVLTESYGFTAKYLACLEGERIAALLPLFDVRSPITGRRGVSLPFTDRCDPLCSDRAGFPEFFQRSRELRNASGWKYLEFRGGVPDDIPPSISYYQHELDLTLSEDALFQNCEPAMRRSIRKAEKESLVVELNSGPEAIDKYYHLHQLTRQKHGIPPQPLRFFRNIHRFLVQKNFGSVLLISLNQKPIAAAIFLHFGSTSVYKFGASDPRYQELRPNNLLLWKGVLRMKQLGARTLSFGRTSWHQEGLRRFKKGFGARESILRYARFNLRSGTFESEQADRASGLHASLFRFCPKPLARLVGAMIYPHCG